MVFLKIKLHFISNICFGRDVTKLHRNNPKKYCVYIYIFFFSESKSELRKANFICVLQNAMCNNMQHNLLCDFSFRPAAIKHKIPLFVFPIPPPLYHHSVHSPLSPFDLFLNVPHASLENWVSFGSWPKPIRIFSGHPKKRQIATNKFEIYTKGPKPLGIVVSIGVI